MPTPTPIPVVSDLLTDTGDVVTHSVTWIGQFCAKIAAEPLLVLAIVAVPLCGLAVGLIGRLLKKRV